MKDKQTELLEQLLTTQVLTLAVAKCNNFNLSHKAYNDVYTDFIQSAVTDIAEFQPEVLKLLRQISPDHS